MSNRVTTIFIFLFLAFAVYAQEQKRVAILNTTGDGELTYLSVRLREIAVKVLPGDKYSIMTAESIIDKLGSKENANKICREAQCLAEIGRKVSAAYVGQARVGDFDGNLTISMELYNAASGTLVDSFTGEARDLSGLLKVINEKAPEMFRKVPGVSSGSKTASVAPVVAGGISGVQSTGGDYEFEGGKSFLASVATEPAGAVVSFNGVPDSRCTKTPCKLELAEGNVRIVAALEQYERADTTVFIKQNNQSISIKLKSNFGVLEIKPAFLDGIGRDESWDISINGKATYDLDNKLSPGKYKVELYHRCYEALSFDAGINKGSREFFDMSAHIKLKKGGLVLNAEKNGEPVSETVFVNGKNVGETPFSGSVPVCAKVEIGSSRETVNVTLKANEKVNYTHRSTYVADNATNYGKNGSCNTETEKAKKLYDRCTKMGRGASGYQQCAADYKAQKAKVEQACRASVSRESKKRP
ncbi:MAG: PEGA domain-containing protein [Fibromonadaceae bacterium]|jgi:hypothetical protein|nr:PEGA domain-containing protein [Fibromonadaceae bacterium]